MMKLKKEILIKANKLLEMEILNQILYRIKLLHNK